MRWPVSKAYPYFSTGVHFQPTKQALKQSLVQLSFASISMLKGYSVLCAHFTIKLSVICNSTIALFFFSFFFFFPPSCFFVVVFFCSLPASVISLCFAIEYFYVLCFSWLMYLPPPDSSWTSFFSLLNCRSSSIPSRSQCFWSLQSPVFSCLSCFHGQNHYNSNGTPSCCLCCCCLFLFFCFLLLLLLFVPPSSFFSFLFFFFNIRL